MGKTPLPITGKAPYAINEITIVEWYRTDGERIGELDPLLHIDSEKAEVDIEAPGEGVLRIAHGMTNGVIVRRPADKHEDKNNPWILTFGWIIPDDEKILPKTEEEGITSRQPTTHVQNPNPEPRDSAPRVTTFQPAESEHKPVHDILAVPRVWREAKERGIDLANVKGTGPKGRVRLGDLPEQRTAESREEVIAQTEISVPRTPLDTVTIAKHDDFIIEETDPLDTRRAIAKNMELSTRCIPYVPTEVRVDFRKILEAHDLLGWMDSQGQIVLKPLKRYLRLEILVIEGILRELEGKYRILNSTWGCEHFPEFRYAKKIWSSVNLGIAYNRPDGLVIPVLKKMEHSSYRIIGDRLLDLYNRMRENKTSKADFCDGTITFNNVGALGSDGGASLVVHGQSVICSLHRVERNISSPFYGFAILSASFDHRIHDGAPIVSFLVAVKHFIETMSPRDFVTHFCNAMDIRL